MASVGRDGDGVERSNAVEVIEKSVIALLCVREGSGEKKNGEEDSAHERGRIAMLGVGESR
jgi:hypothetical protein